VQAGFLQKGVLRGQNEDTSFATQFGTSMLRSELGNMVADVMVGKGMGLPEVVKTIHRKMDLSTAVRQLDGKLPTDVASLVHMTTAKKTEWAV